MCCEILPDVSGQSFPSGLIFINHLSFATTSMCGNVREHLQVCDITHHTCFRDRETGRRWRAQCWVLWRAKVQQDVHDAGDLWRVVHGRCRVLGRHEVSGETSGVVGEGDSLRGADRQVCITSALLDIVGYFVTVRYHSCTATSVTSCST